ncbi:hypothetical protein, partial [Escherichia coli]|uniref:hypothetical protein n=1 Tax=Escherichia coli TaxID=562 RepID=UPI00273FF5E4
WEGWAILLRQKQKKLIMLPSETMIWQPEFTDKTLSRKPGAVQTMVVAFFLTVQNQVVQLMIMVLIFVIFERLGELRSLFLELLELACG